MQPAVQGAWRLNASGRRGRGNEQQEGCALPSNCPTQAKSGLSGPPASVSSRLLLMDVPGVSPVPAVPH